MSGWTVAIISIERPASGHVGETRLKNGQFCPQKTSFPRYSSVDHPPWQGELEFLFSPLTAVRKSKCPCHRRRQPQCVTRSWMNAAISAAVWRPYGSSSHTSVPRKRRNGGKINNLRVAWLIFIHNAPFFHSDAQFTSPLLLILCSCSSFLLPSLGSLLFTPLLSFRVSAKPFPSFSPCSTFRQRNGLTVGPAESPVLRR